MTFTEQVFNLAYFLFHAGGDIGKRWLCTAEGTYRGNVNRGPNNSNRESVSFNTCLPLLSASRAVAQQAGMWVHQMTSRAFPVNICSDFCHLICRPPPQPANAAARPYSVQKARAPVLVDCVQLCSISSSYVTAVSDQLATQKRLTSSAHGHKTPFPMRSAQPRQLLLAYLLGN